MSAHARSLLSHLHRLAAPSAAGTTLLARWSEQRDQQAFASLMARHGPMVLGVCRRLLGDVHEAEDVFQAVFLVLARRASRVRQPEALAGFLHTIAVRLARKARAEKQRRQRVETSSVVPEPVDPRPHPLDVLSGRELLAVLDEEIARLPERYRLPLVLCLLQGRTVEEAARQLDWSNGSLRGRLTRGRDRLRRRLVRRGLDLSVGAVALLSPIAVPEKLLADSLCHLNGSVPAAISALASGILPALKLRIIGLALVLLTAVGLGTVLSFLPFPIAEKAAPSTPAAPPAQAKDEPRRDRYGDPLPPGAIARLGTQRWRASGDVETLAFTPDGQTVLAVSPAGNPLADSPPPNGLCLFDVVSGKRIRYIRPPSTFFGRVALSADGKRLAAACMFWPDDDRRKDVVQILELPSGRKLREFDVKLYSDSLPWLGWSADGHLLAANLGKGEMLLHDLDTGRERRFPAKDLPGLDRDWVCNCVVGKNILAASDEKAAIHVWDLADGEKRYVLKSGGSVVRNLALSANGRWLASLAQDPAGSYCVRLWDTATGEAVHRIASEQKSMDGVIFSPDGKTLATVGWYEVCFWDVATGRTLGRAKGEGRHFGPAVAFSPDGKTLAGSERYSPAIYLWDVPSGTMKPQAQGHTNRPHPPSFSPDGKRVATSSGTIFIWDPETGEPRLRVHRSGGDPIRELGYCAFSADGRTLYSLFENQLIFFDAVSGRELHALKMEDSHQPKPPPLGLSLHLSDDRARLIAVSLLETRNHELLVSGWDTTTRKQLFRYRHPWIDFGYAFSADGRMLALSSHRTPKGHASGPMRLQDAETGELLLSFPALEGQTWPLAFSPDGRLLASINFNWERKDKKGDPAGATGRALHLWEMMTATEVLALPLEVPDQDRTAFSPDGRVLALTAPGGDLLLWDLRRGKKLRRFKGFDAQITSLGFSPDGRRLVSGLSDSTLLVWDVGTPPTAPVEKLGADGIAKAWIELGGVDARRAFRARGKLASAPEEAIALLKKQLHPEKAPDPKCLRRLLADLESEHFDTREKAQKDLEDLGDLAESALRQTLTNKPTLEVRRRVQALLERLRGPVTRPELLQSLRAVAVLEDIGTSEARRLLTELSKGAPEARLTREARESLRRLDLRNISAHNTQGGK